MPRSSRLCEGGHGTAESRITEANPEALKRWASIVVHGTGETRALPGSGGAKALLNFWPLDAALKGRSSTVVLVSLLKLWS